MAGDKKSDLLVNGAYTVELERYHDDHDHDSPLRLYRQSRNIKEYVMDIAEGEPVTGTVKPTSLSTFWCLAAS